MGNSIIGKTARRAGYITHAISKNMKHRKYLSVHLYQEDIV